MGKNPLINAIVIKTGKKVEVYSLSRDKDLYCDYADCKTVYNIMELDFQNKVKEKKDV